MTESESRAWAREWIAKWNRRDVDGVLAHFTDDVVFASPRALAIVGKARISGKGKLAEYWKRAIAAVQSIHFELDHTIWDGRRLGIVYIAEIDGTRLRAVELLTFADSGLVCEGEAMHGATLD